MTIYEFRCNKCGNIFEELVFSSDKDESFSCPECGDSDVCRVLSSFSSGSSSSGSSLGASSCAPSGGFS